MINQPMLGSDQNFWKGRTAYMCLGPLKCLAKIHDLTNTLITFSIIILCIKCDDTKYEEDYWSPGHTYTVTTHTRDLNLRTLDEDQHKLLDQLQPEVTVGLAVKRPRAY